MKAYYVRILLLPLWFQFSKWGCKQSQLRNCWNWKLCQGIEVDVLIPPRLKNREKHKILCVKIDKRSFCIFCIVIMLSLIQLGSIRDNLSPDSLGILGRIYLIETHKKTTISKWCLSRRERKERVPKGMPFCGKFFTRRIFYCKKKSLLKYCSKTFAKFYGKCICELSQLCI